MKMMCTVTDCTVNGVPKTDLHQYISMENLMFPIQSFQKREIRANLK